MLPPGITSLFPIANLYVDILLWDDGAMGKAGHSLRSVLQNHGISQNRLAVAMGVNRSTVNHWFSESRDPAAEAIPRIVNALIAINPAAAREFVELYLGRSLEELNNL